jgi:hypothetical protein
MSQETLPDFEYIGIFMLGAGQVYTGYPSQSFIRGTWQWTRAREV